LLAIAPDELVGLAVEAAWSLPPLAPLVDVAEAEVAPLLLSLFAKPLVLPVWLVELVEAVVGELDALRSSEAVEFCSEFVDGVVEPDSELVAEPLVLLLSVFVEL